MTTYRYYQSRTKKAVVQCWREGRKAVLVVGPTGSGKTVIGASIAEDFDRVLWVAHRQELILQAAEKLRALVGADQVGILMGDHPTNKRARVQVGTIETLLARKAHPRADLLVLDEAHHYEAFSWRDLAAHYRGRDVLTLGLTATPERRDGRGLGDIFEELVNVASYSELIKGGFLVPPVIYGPGRYLGKNIAQDPVTTWERFARGLSSFWFESTVDAAKEASVKLRRRGVVAETINWKTPRGYRETMLEAFSRGDVQVLTNAYCLTEGVDVPDARACISTRTFQFVGGFIQAFGRLARAAPGKTHSVLIDLTGAWHVHGSPTKDRVYTLFPNEDPARKKEEPEGEDDRAPRVLGRVIDEPLYVLDPGPMPENYRYKAPRWSSPVDLSRAKRIGAKHGKRAALSVIEYDGRR